MNNIQAKEGFSLIEVMLAIGIGFGLIGGAIFLYNTLSHRTKMQKTITGLQIIKTGIDAYYAKKDEYPATLKQLREPKLPKDGWGNPYYYKVTKGRKHPYQLYSYGPNGPTEGTTEERISVWD